MKTILLASDFIFQTDCQQSVHSFYFRGVFFDRTASWLTVAILIVELRRGRSGSIVVELQDVLRKKSAFHCRGRLHSEAERHAWGATHLSRSLLLCFCPPLQLRAWVAVEGGDSHRCQPPLCFEWHPSKKLRNWKLQQKMMFFWLSLSGKSGSQASLNHSKLGCGISFRIILFSVVFWALPYQTWIWRDLK